MLVQLWMFPFWRQRLGSFSEHLEAEKHARVGDQ